MLGEADGSLQLWGEWIARYMDISSIGYPSCTADYRLRQGALGGGDHVCTSSVPLALMPEKVQQVDEIVRQMPVDYTTVLDYKYVQPGTETERRDGWCQKYRHSHSTYRYRVKLAQAIIAGILV